MSALDALTRAGDDEVSGGREVNDVLENGRTDKRLDRCGTSAEELSSISTNASMKKVRGATPALWSSATLWGLGGLSIEPSEVLYAFVHLDTEPSDRDAAILDDEERARSQHFRRLSDRRRFITAHASMRILVARCLDIPPEVVRYQRGEFGKPRLESCPGSLEFSLSHSGAIALFAVTRARPVGVDVEQMREIADALLIAEQQFAPLEVAALHSLPLNERSAAFLRYWTHKEAVIKATGEGLGRRLDSFGLDRNGALLWFEGLPGARSGWCLQELVAPSGFVAAGAAASAPGSSPPQWRAL